MSATQSFPFASSRPSVSPEICTFMVFETALPMSIPVLFSGIVPSAGPRNPSLGPDDYFTNALAAGFDQPAKQLNLHFV